MPTEREASAAQPLTVAAFREAMEGLPDGAQVFVNVAGDGTDYAVEYVWASEQIPWSHECDEADEGHRPGRDCPKVMGIEIHAQKAEALDGE